MKKNIYFFSVLFCLIMTLSAHLRIYASAPPPKPPDLEKRSNENNEPPQTPWQEKNRGDMPKESKWYKIQSRDLLNCAIDDNIGLNVINADDFITIGQAARVLSYTKMYLYSDHGYIDEFRKKCGELYEQEIMLMTDFEGKHISELDFITREQLIHLAIHIFDAEISKPAFDPVAESGAALSPDAYTDSSLVSEYYRKDIQKALNSGYIYGTNYGKLLPKSKATLKDLEVIAERIINAQLNSHIIHITFMQFQTKWTELNYKSFGLSSGLLDIFKAITLGIIIAFLSSRFVKNKRKRKKHTNINK